MSKIKIIPVIDIFAGPGGLGEGFSSIYVDNKRVFNIKLSIEKDENAHETLELRSFYRKFDKGKVPDEYYNVLTEPVMQKRNKLKKKLFEKYPVEFQEASKEAWQAELGTSNYNSDMVDQRIKKSLGHVSDWLLIGGPPCQAFSLAGRSRVGGINRNDHRVYLYKEYLRIIAVHHPAVFVMENVKGLLSAEVNGEKVFDWILSDLKNPSSVFKNTNSPGYRIFSLTTKVSDLDELNNPEYSSDIDYLIESEKYGIPQKRHRVILLGIRNDINMIPDTLVPKETEIKLKNIIGDLPKIRSGLSRSFVSSEIKNGKKKRYYKKEINTDENWLKVVTSIRQEILKMNSFSDKYSEKVIKVPIYGTGSEFIECKGIAPENPLYFWYKEEKLKGVCNHESRTHLVQDLKRYMFSSLFSKMNNRFPRLNEYNKYSSELMPDHESAESGKFADRFRVQLPDRPATTITSHISKDGHYFIHYDPDQCRSLTVREAARIQTFPDNYLFCGSRTAQYHQVGNAVPPYLAKQIAVIVYNIFKKL